MSSLNYKRGDVFSSAEAFRPARWVMNAVNLRTQRSLLTVACWVTVFAAATWWLLQSDLLSLGIPSEVTIGVQLLGLLSLLLFLLAGPVHVFCLYFRLNSPVPAQEATHDWEYISYAAADTLLSIKDQDDSVDGFADSPFGRQILLRAGLQSPDIVDTSTSFLETLSAELSDAAVIDVSTVAAAVFATSDRLSEALLSVGITEPTYTAAARWVQRIDAQYIHQTRFWSAERMREIPPLSQDFAYGEAYTLKKFSRSRAGEEIFLGVGTTDSALTQDITAVFNTLSRPRDANVLLVGSPSGGVGDIITTVKSKLQTGAVPDQLKDHKLYVLDTQQLVTAADESKGQFEYLLNKLLVEATLAGNVVLVIENIVEFRQAANQLSVNLLGILNRYLDHPDLPIIFTSTTADYHQHLEGREIMSSLGVVLVHDVDDSTLLKLLEEVAVAHEGGAVCTVGALEATARGARNLITDDRMPHAAVDLFLEIISSHQGQFITKQVVDSYLSTKTGVPTGEISEDERVALSELEDRLRQRVIGQDPAVAAVASALRRNRAGVEDQDRPIGTFLFLGPTGVGKTETAKTLNRVYFEESGLRRLDMSEYSQPNALDILRGSSGTTGRLADMVREKPYGVLLLDEFEKAHSDIHDLFLQILDEGYFSDGRGDRVSLDNMIIIATSNAGAQQIFTYVEAGDDLEDRQKDIIDSLVSGGEFRPELINRFDAAVVFHPLTAEDLIKITQILLGELQSRMKQKGFRLEISDEVAAHLVQQGYDPEFGARAIRRLIQNNVENVIADKIIDEGLSPGDKINLTLADLSGS